MNAINVFIKLLILTMFQVFGADYAILTSVSDDMEYVDGKSTGKKLGTKYNVVCPKMQYLTVTVKVPNADPIVAQEVLDSADEPVLITFEGFTARLYSIRGEIGLTCKADKAVLFDTKAVAHHGKS
ncbi:hypothetical protein RWV98_06650 [Agathobaculum sp. NTUH-O15-33]|uniref:hypothetical protein n=1 Tax=Agathobaculum sp. NTUH-O15-33 TaxID=3079302 RepID=UPI00295831FC|nr:hypothetical protein [Agathobaculum sp. NTUH-O15-33]WNX85942.1 hypothetical protein RWV98_06650 [Agathobaculum sp. NTUH-O15-33]